MKYRSSPPTRSNLQFLSPLRATRTEASIPNNNIIIIIMSDDHHQRPPGFRFYPTEEELLSFYLSNKLRRTREADIDRVIPVTDIHRFDPWQLPEMSGEACVGNTEEWFFMCPQQAREAQGGRPTRTTPSGYWKATGSPGPVYSSSDKARLLGVKKTMVFYQGRAPHGKKTKWKMNEYRAVVEDHADHHMAPGSSSTPAPAPAPAPAPSRLRKEFSLCRVYKNSGSLRSFDRRPYSHDVAAGASENQRAEEHRSSSTNLSGAKRARSGSSSSSSSLDGADSSLPSLQEGNTDGVDMSSLPDIDWDQFGWL